MKKIGLWMTLLTLVMNLHIAQADDQDLSPTAAVPAGEAKPQSQASSSPNWRDSLSKIKQEGAFPAESAPSNSPQPQDSFGPVIQEQIKQQAIAQQIQDLFDNQHASPSPDASPTPSVSPTEEPQVAHVVQVEPVVSAPVQVQPVQPIQPAQPLIQQVTPNPVDVVSVFTKKEEETPENAKFNLNLTAGLDFSQYSLTDPQGGNSQIVSNSIYSFNAQSAYRINDEFRAHLDFGVQAYSLQNPPNQQLSSTSNALYHFMVGASWLGSDYWHLTAKIGFRDLLFFSDMNEPTIDVNKYLVPYGEVSGEYMFIGNKTFQLGAVALLGSSPGFTASSPGLPNYQIGTTTNFGYGLVLRKEFRTYTMDLSIMENNVYENSDQGNMNENQLGVNVTFSLPLDWGK